jgi:hypothetical protein
MRAQALHNLPLTITLAVVLSYLAVLIWNDTGKGQAQAQTQSEFLPANQDDVDVAINECHANKALAVTKVLNHRLVIACRTGLN